MALPEFCQDFDAYQQYIHDYCQQLKLEKPQPDAVKNSLALAQKVAVRIAQEGAVPFETFMQMALYEPGLGYYSSGNQKFGAGGDFVTAPEISPLFAQTFANQFTQIFPEQPYHILELGAGSGIFAVESLLQLEALENLPENYFILEVSAELQARQKYLLNDKASHLATRVQWLTELPQNFAGIVFANEVVDAIPCQRYRKTDAGFEQANISVNAQGFQWQWQATELSSDIDAGLMRQWPGGYLFEYRSMAAGWLESLIEAVATGVIFLVDYGYSQAELYSPLRTQGTLQNYYRHHKHENPLQLIGLQDITASVDFTQLALAADNQNAQILGYAEQAMFLMGAGLEQLAQQKMEQLQASDTMPVMKIGQQLRQLLMPDEMGQSCKVMAIGKNYPKDLQGFTLNNQLHQL